MCKRMARSKCQPLHSPQPALPQAPACTIQLRLRIDPGLTHVRPAPLLPPAAQPRLAVPLRVRSVVARAEPAKAPEKPAADKEEKKPEEKKPAATETEKGVAKGKGKGGWFPVVPATIDGAEIMEATHVDR